MQYNDGLKQLKQIANDSVDGRFILSPTMVLTFAPKAELTLSVVFLLPLSTGLHFIRGNDAAADTISPMGKGIVDIVYLEYYVHLIQNSG